MSSIFFHVMEVEDKECHVVSFILMHFLFLCRDTTRHHRGVHQVNGRCKEGLISWRSPYGAIQLTLGASVYHPNGVEACFLAKSNFTTAKISLESNSENKDSSDPLETLVTLNEDNPEIVNEVCLRSSHETVTLYIEADRDLNSYTIGHVEIEYSLDMPEKSTSLSQDPEEGNIFYNLKLLF